MALCGSDEPQLRGPSRATVRRWREVSSDEREHGYSDNRRAGIDSSVGQHTDPLNGRLPVHRGPEMASGPLSTDPEQGTERSRYGRTASGGTRPDSEGGGASVPCS